MKTKRIKRFTMIEMMVAMAVLVIFLLALMRIFTATQNISENATGKINQFERARIIMDMIATDLQTLYYRPDSGQFCYYQTNHSGGNLDCLSLASMRQETLSGSSNPLLYVNYQYDNVWYLRLKEYAQDNATYWKLNTYTNIDDAMPPPETGSVIAEGIKTLKITPFDVNWGTMDAAAMNRDKAPRTVQIELELYSDQTIEVFHSPAFQGTAADGETTAQKEARLIADFTTNVPANIRNNGTRKFVRVISIKRDR